MKQPVVYYDDLQCGWKRFQCPHCKVLIPSPYESDRVFCTCQPIPEWHEFGAWVEVGLQVIYLDKRRWLWLKHKLGLETKCGCQQRAEALNTWGQKLRGVLGRLWYHNGKEK